jgi:hypothetical protein
MPWINFSLSPRTGLALDGSMTEVGVVDHQPCLVTAGIIPVKRAHILDAPEKVLRVVIGSSGKPFSIF